MNSREKLHLFFNSIISSKNIKELSQHESKLTSLINNNELKNDSNLYKRIKNAIQLMKIKLKNKL